MLSNIVVDPFTRINDEIHLSTKLSHLLTTEHQKLQSIPYDRQANNAKTHHQLLDIQQSFLYVCTETVFNYPTVYLTEKSFKGITAKRPFVILGAPGSVNKLKEFGFMTFDQWWDESYDAEMSDQVRLMKIYAIIKRIHKKSLNELQDLISEMAPILEYNFNHYKTFGDNQVAEFQKQCILNLNR